MTKKKFEIDKFLDLAIGLTLLGYTLSKKEKIELRKKIDRTIKILKIIKNGLND